MIREYNGDNQDGRNIASVLDHPGVRQVDESQETIGAAVFDLGAVADGFLSGAHRSLTTGLLVLVLSGFNQSMRFTVTNDTPPVAGSDGMTIQPTLGRFLIPYRPGQSVRAIREGGVDADGSVALFNFGRHYNPFAPYTYANNCYADDLDVLINGSLQNLGPEVKHSEVWKTDTTGNVTMRLDDGSAAGGRGTHRFWSDNPMRFTGRQKLENVRLGSPGNERIYVVHYGGSNPTEVAA